MQKETRSAVVLSLSHKRNNPRNSEGAFVTLADGRILFVYTRYYGKSWADEATADLCARSSADGGRTWTDRDEVIVKNEGRRNVMSVSLLRLQDGRIGLWYLRKNGSHDCRPYLRVSADEGAHWSSPVCCIPAPGYFVVNNDRIVQLRNGRLIVPASLHRCKSERDRKHEGDLDSKGLAIFFYSDDAGKTWRESPTWWALPVYAASGLQEPGLIELRDGRLYSWIRTSTGRQWEMRSRDHGVTWSAPRPSRFHAPCAPLSMKRIPATGDLLAVWNDIRLARPKKKLVDGWVHDSSWGRTPLAAAISRNEGRSWSASQLIERDALRGFCYIAIHFAEDAALLAYCCGGRGSGVLQDLCIRRIPLAWFYQNQRHA